MTDPRKEQLKSVLSALARCGFDLQAWFSPHALNQQLTGPYKFPVGGAASSGLLLGNTKALFPVFLAWLNEDEARLTLSDPLDRYVEQCVTRVSAPLTPDFVGYSHVLVPAPLPMQQIAELSGLASIGPTHLNIHPVHGPWIALRAVLLFPFELPLEFVTGRNASPCETCPRPCLDPPTVPTPKGLSPEKIPWFAARAACPVGTLSRYGEAQVVYHYEHDATVLKDASVLEDAALLQDP